VQNKVGLLEFAAAEMARAANCLVVLERKITETPVRTDSRLQVNQAWHEAAAELRTNMAVMDALLAARHKPESEDEQVCYVCVLEHVDE
jgi:hypothetical protein